MTKVMAMMAGMAKGISQQRTNNPSRITPPKTRFEPRIKLKTTVPQSQITKKDHR